jgi:hypothetical protein
MLVVTTIYNRQFIVKCVLILNRCLCGGLF